MLGRKNKQKTPVAVDYNWFQPKKKKERRQTVNETKTISRKIGLFFLFLAFCYGKQFLHTVP